MGGGSRCKADVVHQSLNDSSGAVSVVAYIDLAAPNRLQIPHWHGLGRTAC